MACFPILASATYLWVRNLAKAKYTTDICATSQSLVWRKSEWLYDRSSVLMLSVCVICILLLHVFKFRAWLLAWHILSLWLVTTFHVNAADIVRWLWAIIFYYGEPLSSRLITRPLFFLRVKLWKKRWIPKRGLRPRSIPANCYYFIIIIVITSSFITLLYDT